MGDFPLPHPSPVVGSKRERDSDSPKSAATPDYAMSQDAPGPPHKVSRAKSFTTSRQVAIQPAEYGQMLEPMPLLPNPNFMYQQPTASGSGNNTAGVQQWFGPQPNISGAGAGSHPGSAYGSPGPAQPVLQQLFGTGAEASQQVYPQSAPPFEGSFAPQDGQHVFPNGANGIPTAAVQNPTWGDTLNMWSTAPTGFECVLGQC